jgi:hypothetical protein
MVNVKTSENVMPSEFLAEFILPKSEAIISIPILSMRYSQACSAAEEISDKFGWIVNRVYEKS